MKISKGYKLLILHLITSIISYFILFLMLHDFDIEPLLWILGWTTIWLLVDIINILEVNK